MGIMPTKKTKKKPASSVAGTAKKKKTKKANKKSKTHKRNTKGLRPPWPKGVSGNPKGPPKLSEEVRQFRKMDRREVSRMIRRWGQLTVAELQAAEKDKSTTMLDRYIISLYLKGEKKGNPINFDILLNRAIGKVPNEEIVDISSTDMNLENVSDEGLREIRAILIRERQGDKS